MDASRMDRIVSGSSLTGFPPTSIEGDVSLYENATLHGWSGTGSQGDPIVVEDLFFDANGTGYAFSISNTTMHVLFLNCTFYNTSLASDNTISGLRSTNNSMISVAGCNFTATRNGIYALDTSLHVTGSNFTSNAYSGILALEAPCIVVGCNFSGNQYGVYLQYCGGSVIRWNNFTGNREGVYIISSPETLIDENLLDSHFGNGIFIAQSDETRVMNNTYMDNGISGNGNGLYLRDSNLLFINNETMDGNRVGVYLYRTTDSIIGNSTIKNCMSYGVHLANSVTRYNITRNHLLNCQSGVYIYGSSTSNYNTIYDNTIENCTQNGVQINGVHQQNNVVRNTINNCSTGIRSYNSRTNYINNNRIDGSPESGIYLYFTISSVLRGNCITDSTLNGISLIRSDGNTLSSNSMESNNAAGLYIENSNTNTLVNNDIKDSQSGVEISFSDGSILEGNRISDCGYGITCRGADRGSMDGNVLLDSVLYGLTLSESNENFVSDNTIMKSKFHGLNLISSSNNVLFNNALAYNNNAGDVYNSSRPQAQDNMDTNTYYRNERGNYWKDLTGPDSNSDGIVDSPYRIGGLMNSDPYPLTSTEFNLVPSSPVNLSSRSFQGSAYINWSPPEDDGGERILGYRIYRKNSTGKFLMAAVKDAEANHHWDISLVNGETYTYYVTAFNIVGEGPISEKVTATPDDSIPVIEILSPSEGSFLNEKDVVVTWKASDGADNIIEFKVKLDDGPWTSTGMSKEMTVSVVDNGSHTIHVHARDEAGNSNMVSVNFTMDREIPQLTIVDPMEGSWTNDTSIFISWVMDDLFSGINHVEARWDDVYWIDKGLSGNMTIMYLDEGPHTIHIRVFDNAGNSVMKVVNTSIDTTDPEVWIEYPETGHLTNEPSFWFRWVGMDRQSDTRTFSVKVDNGSWSDIGVIYNTTVDLGAEGAHIVYLMIIDNAGNRAVTSLEVFLDSIEPDILEYGPTGENCDPGNVQIYAALSEFLDPNNMVFTLNDAPGMVTWTTDRRAVLTPIDDLRFGTLYKVFISGTDSAGNILEPFTWFFSTDDRGYVKGRVLDTSNFPVKTATVSLSGMNQTGVDGAGNFMLTISSGTWTVMIQAPGYVPFIKEIEVRPGETYDLGPVRLDESVDVGKIIGRVLDEDGKTLLGVIVTVDNGDTLTTPENGQFQLTVEVGIHTVSFSRDGYERVVREVNVTKDSIVDLGDIELSSTTPSTGPDGGGIELWQLQLAIFLVILIIGIVFIFFILRGSGGRAGKEEEE
ncbi:MAG: right-handed parallel beta-helix repeat-containing protein [Candidatus Thermoplasmatota archaeon]|nr:right-handed parallel beta-helix repeat-containing protein [Candidatus Thermoplasmatota archaeon]